MTLQAFEFIKDPVRYSRKKDSKGLDLCYAYPSTDSNQDRQLVITRDSKTPRSQLNFNQLTEDGLYACLESPLTRTIVKPYPLDHSDITKSKPKLCGKLLEIAIRKVIIHSDKDIGTSTIRITSVAILFKEKVICKATSPFNKQLYKLLVRNSSESANLSIRVRAQGGISSTLPLPLPKHCVKDNKLEIDFAIADNYGTVHSGTVVCTISLNINDQTPQNEYRSYLYSATNDPNDPQNSMSLFRSSENYQAKEIGYFLLEHPALRFNTGAEENTHRIMNRGKLKAPDNVILEEPIFSLWDLSFRNWFQSRRPLRPSSGTCAHKHRTDRKEILTITILRGVEVPVREESALIQPLVEIKWGDITHSTTVADGPAPVWQQTIHFEMPRQNDEQCVTLRLFDQHPAWGLQWLGEARIPLESRRSYQQLERWVGLSPLHSPVMLFGYVQASPGHSYTRLYILMKVEQPGNLKSVESNSIDTLSKAVHRCVAVPYKISGIDISEDAARLTMLLLPLPIQYGPLTPRQALNLNKVDHYGRAALLATLLQGLGLQSFVLLGTSQTRKWAAFVLTVDDNADTTLWDPENGDHYTLEDNRCPLVRVSHLINHQNIWENTQKVTVPFSLKYNIKSSKDWRPIHSNASSSGSHTVQTFKLNSVLDEEEGKDLAQQMEQHLKDKLAQSRSAIGLPTIFNRHAMTILHDFLSKLEDSTKSQSDKKELRQLYRAYHTHGFVLNLRNASLDELSTQLLSTKVHNITGPVEFALVCHVQRYIGHTCSVWLAMLVLRSRD